MKALGHIAFVAAALLLCLGLPTLLYWPSEKDVDAVSGASLEIPDQPSGAFIVLLNREKHPLELEAWSDFFLEKPVGVIMEDISCMTAAGDTAGEQLARRYQARLAENQMRLRSENGMLVVSRAENGLYDVIVLSREAADAFDYDAVYQRQDTLVLTVVYLFRPP